MTGHGDIKAHEQSYAGFIRMVKMLTAVSVAIAAVVIWLIAS